jgi:type II secretory pathway predicted ATPase ExeA
VIPPSSRVVGTGKSAEHRMRAEDATHKLKAGTVTLVDSHRRMEETTEIAEAIIADLASQREVIQGVKAKAIAVKEAATEGETIAKRMNSIRGWFS